jgi:hypothetical protein
MAEFIDLYPTLPQAIDVGGDRYFMGPQKPIELGFKTRKDYLNAFDENQRTEYLLRKYMPLTLKSAKRTTFESPKDKADLIAILKRRAQKLEESKQFTSSVLKNTLIQRSYLNILKLIQDFEGPDYKGIEFPSLPDISLPCTKAKKYIKQIPEERLFQLMLEMSWYLLHPDMVPAKAQCDWAKAVKELDTLRLGDLFAKMKKAEQDAGIEPTKQAFNYFKSINLENVVKAKTRENALEQAQQMAMKLQGANTNEKMKDRLKTLLDILIVKKYLNGEGLTNEDRLKVIDSPDVAARIQRSMIDNPMAGGATQAFEEPLRIAMMPFFDYFKTVYDPIYPLVEGAFIRLGAGKNTTKKILIPQLTTILHICNNLKPVENPTGGQHTYGIFKVTNVEKDIVDFFTKMLTSTQMYLDRFPDDKNKNTFSRQLFSLPKVRLSSLISSSVDGYKDPDTIPYVQFFTVGGNMTLMEKTAFLDASKPERTEDAFKAVSEFFTPNDLYIACTDSATKSSQEIPLNTYEINYDEVRISETGLKFTSPDNYFNKNKNPDVHLEDLTTLTPYVIFNDAELALCIFAAFKELMPQ